MRRCGGQRVLAALAGACFFAAAAAGARAEGPRVLDADRGLRMVAMDRGERQGIRIGMEFGVMREERVVARVRVVDVRPAVAGAVVVRVDGRSFPRAGDRLLPISGRE